MDMSKRNETGIFVQDKYGLRWGRNLRKGDEEKGIGMHGRHQVAWEYVARTSKVWRMNRELGWA